MLGYYFIYYWEGLAYEADHGTGPCGPIALAGKKRREEKQALYGIDSLGPRQPQGMQGRQLIKCYVGLG